MKEYLKVGTILKPRGLNGEVKVFSTTSFKNIRYKKGNELFIDLGDQNYLTVHIKKYASKEGNIDVLLFEEFNDINSLEPILGKDLLIVKDETVLKKDEYFFSDLEGLIVFDESKNELGKVIKVEEFPSQITLKVEKPDKKTFFVPFNDFFIKEINISNNYIIINVIEGLVEWNLLYLLFSQKCLLLFLKLQF